VEEFRLQNLSLPDLRMSSINTTGIHLQQQRGRDGKGSNAKQSREEEAESRKEQDESRSGGLVIFIGTAYRKSRRRQEILLERNRFRLNRLALYHFGGA
jgi:hypothetical protein